MKDEYGSLDSSGEIYVADEPFLLESGIEMHQAQVCYTTYGVLNETKDNVLVVCHALTGNAALSSWWGPMLGT
jgi:homoserine O-acetyltransferase/O-succinyltransferase